MNNKKLQQYWQFFKLQKRDKEREFEQYENSSLNTLFETRKAFFGEIVGVSEHGQIIMRFDSKFTPRLKIPMTLCLVKSKAFDVYGSSIREWRCTSIQFRKDTDAHAHFTDALPIYFLNSKNVIGCGRINIEMIEVVKLGLKEHRDMFFVMLESLPPTELLKNLADYIDIHPTDKNLLLEPKIQYDDWKPIELASTENVAEKVINSLDRNGICVLQGPPGTGKSHTMGEIISKVTVEGKSVCVTTQSNASLISLISQDTMKPFIDRKGVICKTVLTAEEKKKHPFLTPANKELSVPMGGVLCSTYYSLSRIINKTDKPVYDLIIIEEASQAYLTAIAAFMRLGKRCIIVGDPMQLPPVVDIKNEYDYRGIDIETQSNGMMTYIRSLDVPSFRITTSYRLTPASTDLTKVFYNGHLTSVQKEKTVFNVPSDMSPFFPQEGGTIIYNTEGSSGAVCSKGALEIIRKIVSLFKAYYPKRRLAILSPYVATTDELQKEFYVDNQKLDLLIETIHRIQGETVDYTIFYIPIKNSDFAFSDNLFNVATSRSRSTTLLISDLPDFYPVKSVKVLKFLSNCKTVDFTHKQNVNREEIKEYYPGYESLVDTLLDNNIEFSYEGDVDLLDPNDVVLATAGLLLEKYNIAIDPVDDDSRQIFERAGYRVVSSKDFRIDMLK